MMADEKEAIAPSIGLKNGREHSIALDIMEGLKEDGLGTLEIAAVVGRLQLLVLDEIESRLAEDQQFIKEKGHRTSAPVIDGERIVGRKHDIYDACVELSRFDVPDICRALRDVGGKYWKEEPTERAVKKLIRGVKFVKKDGLKKGRQAYVLVRDENAPLLKEADP